MALKEKDRWIIDALNKGYLRVDFDGTIRRCKSASIEGKMLSPVWEIAKPRTHKKSGRVYFMLTWRGHRKSVLVNRVVAWAFLPNPLDLPQVNHIDGVKAHNDIGNLEWSSGVDNEKHAHRTGLKSGRGTQNANVKLSPADIPLIRESRERPSVLAERFGVARSTIVNVVNRSTWRHLP